MIFGEPQTKPEEPPCPLCGESKHMPLGKPLYGHWVCANCYYGFAHRRQLAFFLDIIGLQLLRVGARIVLGVLIYGVPLLFPQVNRLNLVGFGLDQLVLTMFLYKDGFGGQSPGKALLGVRAVDARTGKPLGFSASFKRNLPLMIPFMPLVVAIQLCKGQRTGDGWAHSKVVWNRYADHPIFAVEETATPVFDPAMLEQLENQPDDGNPYRSPTL